MTTDSSLLQIKVVAQRTGLSPKAIRDYEKLGLITAIRAENGYRLYSEAHVNRLQFIRRARAADFSLPQIADLLMLRDNPERDNREVKALVGQHLQEVRNQIRELQKAEQTLAQLYVDCLGDGNSYCAIIDGLEGEVHHDA